MSKRHPINESDIKLITSPKVFARGQEYFADGMVSRVVQRGDVLFADVQGSEEDPYRLIVAVTERGIEAPLCSCPYDWDDACKHVVAALLTYVHRPDEIEQRAPVAQLLQDLDVAHLRRLVHRLVEAAPQLVDVVEDELQRLTKRTTQRGTR
jgi:uncharacterized Zn finger protein